MEMEMKSFSGVIRGCEPDDVPSITQIYAHYVLHELATYETEPPDVREMQRRRAEILTGGFPYLVAEIDREIVGYSYAGFYRTRSAYRYTVENSVYIDHERLRQGIGQALLGSLISECGRKGFHQMIAVIGNSANSASIGLHERLGFRMVGTLYSVGFKFGQWVDSVLMQRELGSPV